MNYTEKLKSPKWQKKRLEVLQRDDFKCCLCNDTETELHVHHLKYTNEPYDAPLYDLQTLCKHCHYYVTFYLKDECEFYNEDINNFKIIKSVNSLIISFEFSISIYLIRINEIEKFGTFFKDSKVIDILYNLKYNL